MVTVSVSASHAALLTRYPRTLRLDEDGALEKRCGHCHEWWPPTREFFYSAPGHTLGLHCDCIACVLEWKRERRARQRRTA